jgi:hypothetical protein
MRFYNHPEGMVRTTVRNIILSVLKLCEGNEKLYSYSTNFPFVVYFVHFSLYLRDTWVKIDKEIENVKKNNNMRVVNLKSYFEDHLDLLLYIDDIFKLNLNKLSDIFSNTLLNYAIFPCLLSSIKKSKKGQISFNLAQYLLTLIIKTLSYCPLVSTILLYLFKQELHANLLDFTRHNLKAPLSYTYEWKYSNFWDENGSIV